MVPVPCVGMAILSCVRRIYGRLNKQLIMNTMTVHEVIEEIMVSVLLITGAITNAPFSVTSFFGVNSVLNCEMCWQ